MGLSLKLTVLSATVVSTAIMLNLLSPFITNNFTVSSDIPIIWTTLVSWLKPPYLYVVINCIIITIVASSRLQSKLDCNHHSPAQPGALLQTEPVKTVIPVELPVQLEILSFHDGVYNTPPVDIGCNTGLNPQFVEAPEPEFNKPEFNKSRFDETPELEFNKPRFDETPELEFNKPRFDDELLDEDMKIAKEAYEEIKKNKVNKYVISMSTWMPSEMNDVGLSFPAEKPPASARFSHRKPAKATTEGVRTLRVVKPKRQDTLETTWKAITEGRSVPLTRHLRKSDTWETHTHCRDNRTSNDFPPPDNNRMTKSDTFSGVGGGADGRVMKPPPASSKLSRSGGSGRLRKEPSLGQEELNRRVEAFIKKFNEEMRLQRQQSLNQYMEMINRGAG